MKNLYPDALPLGPLIEVGAQDGQSAFTPERAQQSVDYWLNIARDLLADPAASGSSYALKAYSKDVNSTANLLAAHDYTGEAEAAYRLSSQICPDNLEAAMGLAAILARTGRADDARQLLEAFARNYPDQHAALEQARGGVFLTGTRK